MEDLTQTQTQCSANFEPLSPITFLERAASVYGDEPSLVYGTSRFSWSQTHHRCLKLASALSTLLISNGKFVAALAPNIPALYELHFAVPMAGAVLSALNTRLGASMLARTLHELEATIIFVDYQFVNVVLEAFSELSTKQINQPLLVIVQEQDREPSSTTTIRDSIVESLDYEAFLGSGSAEFDILRPMNEMDPISVSFTSGSTGNPKGAVYSHRAAYLNSLAVIGRYGMKQTSVFLWTVDMFRCNGWCFPWAMAALGATNICLRKLSARVIFDSLVLHNVTHFCGSPRILNLIADAPPLDRKTFSHKVEVTVAGVMPPAAVLKRVQDLGFSVNEGYGMTEALGPAIVRPCHPRSKKNKVKFLQGLHNIVRVQVDVKDIDTMKSVPCDGRTIGEVVLKGNPMMSGYLKNLKLTREAFKGGWYMTGDLGVRNEDGYVQIKDRAKDIIRFEGRAISSLEIESVLLTHPKVSEAAVVGKRDDCSGQVPCAFVKLKEGCGCASDEDVIEFCERHLEHCMVPKQVVYGDLPVNTTGKILKFVLRDKVDTME